VRGADRGGQRREALAQHLLAGDLGVAVGGALFGVPVDRAQQRVDVDECLLLDPDQQLGARGQGAHVLAQHRLQLAGVPEAELAQQRAQRGGCVDIVEQDRHPSGAQHVQVIDAVRAGAHPGDHAQQLGRRVRRAGLDPRCRDRHLRVEDLRQPGLLGQPEQRHQSRVRHEIVLVEACRAGGEPVADSH
jgi:hypothetical protein